LYQLDSELATEKQKKLMDDLTIYYDGHISKRQASKLISNKLNGKPKKKQTQEFHVNPTTMKLSELIKKRHENELVQGKKLKSIKDWIDADYNKWESELNNKGKDTYYINLNQDSKLDKKIKYHSYIKNNDRKERQIKRKL